MTPTTRPPLPLGARPWLGVLLAGGLAAWTLAAGAYASAALGFLVGAPETTRPARAVLAVLLLALPLVAVAVLALLLQAVGVPAPVPVALGTAVLLDVVAVGGHGFDPLRLVVPGVVAGSLVAVTRPGRRPRERLPGVAVLVLLLLASAVVLTG